MNLIGLPRDNIIDILLNTNTNQLNKLCLIHPSINQICNDDNFWRLKLNKDFSLYNNPTNSTWKDYYMLLYIPKQIPVYIDKQQIGTISIRRTETMQDLINKGNQIYYSSPVRIGALQDEIKRGASPDYLQANLDIKRSSNDIIASFFVDLLDPSSNKTYETLLGSIDPELSHQQISLMELLDEISSLNYEDIYIVDMDM